MTALRASSTAASDTDGGGPDSGRSTAGNGTGRRRARIISWFAVVTVFGVILIAGQRLPGGDLRGELRWLLRDTPSQSQWNLASTLLSLAAHDSPTDTAAALRRLLADPDPAVATNARTLLATWPLRDQRAFAELLDGEVPPG